MAVSEQYTVDARLECIEELCESRRVALQQEAADAAGVAVRFRDVLPDGSEGPEMVVIPPGVFYMGSPETEFGHRPEEGPQQLMSVPGSFAIGRFTVTAEQFERFRHATGWYLRPDLIWVSGTVPVINVRLSDARLYARWLSEQTGASYRLPTEAEWEYAARAGATTPFHFGESVSCREVHFNPSFPYEEARQRRRWYLPRCVPMSRALAVGSKPANLWGLHEVHGNVWEFTESRWTESHTGVVRDARHATARAGGRIVTRGGSWFDAAVLARSAARRPRVWDELDVNLGFRLVRAL